MKNRRLLWLVILIFVAAAATGVKQLIGPSAPTTTNSVAIFIDSTGYKLTNSPVIIDGLGNISGVGTQQISQVNTPLIYTTNGIIYIIQSSAPTAAFIGGIVGSVTNSMIRCVNGVTILYWSDGTTLYSKILGPP